MIGSKRFRQIHDTNYDETFFSIAILKSIWNMLAIIAFYDYAIWEMDVKTTFLNVNLLEDVYMTQPKGFATLKITSKVCKLQ